MAVIEQTFGILVTLATNLLNTPPAGAEQEIPVILHLILKSYKHSIVLNLSRHQQSPESLVPWGRLLFQVLNLRLPADAVPADEEERERSEWWKAKKWSCGILGRLFFRYGVYYRYHISCSRMEVQLLMFTQVRQSFSAAQPIARRIRGVRRSLCKSICARDL